MKLRLPLSTSLCAWGYPCGLMPGAGPNSAGIRRGFEHCVNEHKRLMILSNILWLRPLRRFQGGGPTPKTRVMRPEEIHGADEMPLRRPRLLNASSQTCANWVAELFGSISRTLSPAYSRGDNFLHCPIVKSYGFTSFGLRLKLLQVQCDPNPQFRGIAQS